MDFEIITAGTPAALTAKVRHAIQNGWEIQGHPFHNPDSAEWCQAVIKRIAASAADLRLKEKRK